MTSSIGRIPQPVRRLVEWYADRSRNALSEVIPIATLPRQDLSHVEPVISGG
jgi:hypothetical protein